MTTNDFTEFSELNINFLLMMIGASAVNAAMLVIVNAIKLHRSQLVEQVKTIGPAFDSPPLWIVSMTFCEIPMILFTELFCCWQEKNWHINLLSWYINNINNNKWSNHLRFYWPHFCLQNSYMMRFICFGWCNFYRSFDNMRHILFRQYCYNIIAKCCVDI